MIEGQEGVSWEQWVALARAAEDAELDGALPLRPLPLDRPRRAGRRARRLGDARRARRGDEPDPARHAGLAGHVPPRAGAREAGHDRRPHLRRPRRARPRRRLVRVGARRVRVRLPAAARADGRARPPARRDRAPLGRRARDPAEAAAAAASADHRRRNARSRAPSAPRSRTPTSTTPSGRPSRRRASASAPSTTPRDAAGREPLRFSMMTSCVVAHDDAGLRERSPRSRR